MTFGEAASMIVPSLVSGVLAFALRGARDSARRLGERVGTLEKWIDFEEGRRKGYAEALAERARDEGK